MPYLDLPLYSSDHEDTISFYKGMKHFGDGTECGLRANVEYSQGFSCLCGMSDEESLLSLALLYATS
jgi:hypothetical protein